MFVHETEFRVVSGGRGSVWRAMAMSGGPWQCLEGHGNVWRAMATSGGPWQRLEGHGNVWRAMADTRMMMTIIYFTLQDNGAV